MTDVLSLSLAALRQQARRYLAPGLAVVLGVAFIAATLVLTGTLDTSIRSAVAGQYEPYAAVVTTEDATETLPDETAAAVRDLPGVTAVDPIRSGSALVRGVSGERFALVTTEGSRIPHPVIEGRAPRAPDEVSLSRTVASGSDLGVGDRVTFAPFSTDDGQPVTATVVGLVDVGEDPRFAGGTPAVFATADGVTQLTGATGWDEIDVVAPGAQEAVAEQVRTGLSGDLVVRTATEHADEQVAAITGGSDVLGAFFTAFAVIALFVSAIVIANTFAILLARRARETAMLRAVGATRAQVVASALVEALVVGLIFSVAGVAAGAALARVLVGLANTYGGDTVPPLELSVPGSAVVVPVVVGVLVVLLAAIRPVLRSSRVAPLEALRPEAAVTARSRRGAVRIGSGLLLIVAGAAALVVSATAHSVLVGVVGGLVSFTGVLLAGSILVPLVARVVGLVAARPFGPAGRLAVDNAVRNPARAAATASALLVGVTLVTMTAVGASTAKVAITDYIDARYPVDVVVRGDDVPASVVDRLDEVDGVVASTGVPASSVTVEDAAVDSARVVAPGDSLVTVVRDPSAVPSVGSGEVVLSEEMAAEAGVSTGDTLTLTGPKGAGRVSVEVADGLEDGWVVDESTLSSLGTEASVGSVYLRLADGADVDAAIEEIREVASGIDGVEVGGGAPVRSANMGALDLALAVVLALLAVSVVIAVVGIANTLSLSVIERTRESALLRALGLTRGQLRGMLAIEAVLLACVGVVLGVLLGTGYAWAGTSALFGQYMSITPALPWGQLAVVVAGAVVAGLLASVLPARRAARVSPAAALAVE